MSHSETYCGVCHRGCKGAEAESGQTTATGAELSELQKGVEEKARSTKPTYMACVRTYLLAQLLISMWGRKRTLRSYIYGLEHLSMPMPSSAV